MKFLRNVLLGLLLVYVLIWAGIAVYFSYVDRNKSLFETHLSRYFARPVTIDVLQTSWRGLSPRVKIEGFYVTGNAEEASPLAFESLTAQLSPWSVLTFWPRFSEFSVEKPVLEVASINASQISVGGIILSFEGGASLLHPKTVVRWLLDQHSTQWSDGTIVWRRQSGRTIEYTNISFTFDRENQERVVLAGFSGVDGAVNFKAQSDGDLLSEDLWGASLEVVNGEGQAFVAPDDFSLLVDGGKGELKLKRLQVQTIQDFIELSGLSKKISWLSQAQVSGYLHDMALEFSGSLFAIKDWQLKARATEFGFESAGNGPKIDNLNGQVKASKAGGQFLFATQGSLFEWKKLFDSPFEISAASGEFAWSTMADGSVKVSLRDGQFDDGIAKLSNLSVATVIERNDRNINSLGGLFTVDSVSELNYDGQRVVEPSRSEMAPLNIDATAEFTMGSMAYFHHYFPKVKKLTLLREWWAKAFSKGSVSNGQMSFQGPLSISALDSGTAFFNLSADFTNVAVDYGHPQSWPIVERSKGKLKIINDELTIHSDDAYIGGDRMRDFNLRISSLFKKNLVLNLEGKVTKSLREVVDLIFKGPLIAKENQLSVLPVRPGKGDVDLDMSVRVPLKDIRATSVKGSAVISDALAYLPGDVPVIIANGTVNFTEKSIDAKQLKATFLGGDVIADITTVKQAQPPAFKVSAKGTAALTHLKPWLGGHVLSLMDGVTTWEGGLLVDGNTFTLEATSNLSGITINAPEPLSKPSQERRDFSLKMGLGNYPTLALSYGEVMSVTMSAKQAGGSLFDRSLIHVSNNGEHVSHLSGGVLSEGVNLEIHRDDINLDQFMATIISLAEYEPAGSVSGAPSNNVFVDSMRSISIKSSKPVFLNRAFGVIDLTLLSDDGASWSGDVKGDNISGSMELNPFESDYQFNLSHLLLTSPLPDSGELEVIDYSLEPVTYPSITAIIDDFNIIDKKLGRLELIGAPVGDVWELSKFEMDRDGVKTVASGRWLNNDKLGSMTSIDFNTQVEQADSAMDDFSLGGFIKKGSGSIVGSVSWIGAPHEFDYSRLNGDFDMQLFSGELLKVEPGGGKLLGLFNFNAVARRLSFDFRDVFAEGLTFDRMQYKGLFSDGKAIMQEAFILTPAVFVRMEGQVDIANEMIDMEIHISPEVGGNLALFSALANPAAGAVVFITQRIFKEQIRDVNFTSFRALGSWEEFEVVPFGASEELSSETKAANDPTDEENEDKSSQNKVEPLQIE